MNNKGVGFGFIAVAAFLFAMRFLCAAIYAGDIFKSDELFRAVYGFIGPDLTIASGMSLVAGLLYLLRAEGRGRGE